MGKRGGIRAAPASRQLRKENVMEEKEIRNKIYSALEFIIVEVGGNPYGIDTQDERTRAIVADLAHELYLKLFPPAPEEIREIAKNIINKLSEDISDRRGLKNEWAKIDKEVMDDLKAAWEIIIQSLTQPLIEQAFESGQKTYIDRATKVDLESIEKTGRQDVVEFVDTHIYMDPGGHSIELWQAQKKSWGIK